MASNLFKSCRAKLSTRDVSRKDVEHVVANPDHLYEDIEHDTKAAIGSQDGTSLVVIYSLLNGDIKVITVYHTRKIEKLVSAKIERGAWRRTR